MSEILYFFLKLRSFLGSFVKTMTKKFKFLTILKSLKKNKTEKHFFSPYKSEDKTEISNSFKKYW
jgi:hypothetical protein